MKSLKYTLLTFLLCLSFVSFAQKQKLKVIAFYTAQNDLAHISFVGEANKWFPEIGIKHHFSYEATDNWENLNDEFLSKFQMVIFLDTRPETDSQRAAFQRYMENGGAWMGFHFAGFALNNSKFPQNWDWYHEEFLGVGQYKSNTWRPTSAILKIENRKHPIAKKLPKTFVSAPTEWYRWEKDLQQLPNFKILLSIDPPSFPLGTGPKPHEIWHSGYYPVVWTNTNYKMIYFNMGHNDMDYIGKTNKQLSSTFSSEPQNRLIINSLKWLGKNYN
ncbi:MAG: ThuA domain-containing protein [Bacteroidota bacterium]